MSRSTIVCVGEPLVVLTPPPGTTVRDARTLVCDLGGAELNVALTLARLGISTAYLARVGGDGFGEHVLQVAREHRVDVSAVQVDQQRATGLYVKDPGTAADGSRRSSVHYYRSDSAASAMSPAFLASPALQLVLSRARTVHVSGINPGLSAGAADFCAALAAQAHADGIALSVDLNYRESLWRGKSLEPLLALLAAADEVMLGADEATAVLGTDDPDDLAGVLGHARRILLKREEHGVTVISRGQATIHVPALVVDVVEPVGAGDAFAAGYLAASHRGDSAAAAAALGHRCAAAAMRVRGDRPLEVPTP